MIRVSIAIFAFTVIGIVLWFNQLKITPYYHQLTKERVGLNIDLQPAAQKEAHFVGSDKCQECHNDEHHDWKNSLHAKMIQSIKENPNVVVADFSKLPPNADFTLKDAIFTVGSKFKQRYMIPATINNKEDYRLGNYQWNVEIQQWQSFKPYKYWYSDAYPHDNKQFPTSTTCDGCHFVGYLSSKKRVEPSIGCESCHGAGSNHVDNPDKRLDGNLSIKDLWMNAKDYPTGYEAGKPLIHYKKIAPFKVGTETKEFWANGAAKKNRTQGNEYIHSGMYQHGITCVNCHNPHKLTNTAQKPEGNQACMKCHSFGSIIGPHQSSLEAHTHHKADSKGSLCIECHMPKIARHTKKSPLTVRSHLFGFTSPAETMAYGMPPETNACFACHQDRSLESLQESLEVWGMVGFSNL